MPIKLFPCKMLTPHQGRSSVVEQRPFKPKVVGSIPTAPTNHPICLEHLSDFARRQKAAIRNKTGLLGGTDGSSKAKSDCGLNCSPYFEESQASSTVKDTLDSAEDLHAGVTFMISRNTLNCLGKWPSKAI